MIWIDEGRSIAISFVIGYVEQMVQREVGNRESGIGNRESDGLKPLKLVDRTKYKQGILEL